MSPVVKVALTDLTAAAERVLSYPPERIDALARRSALWSVSRRPGATVLDVVREQGLSEENAKRALSQLAAMGCVRLRPTGGYEAIGGAS